MAESLQIDLVFAANPADALAALSDIGEAVDAIGRSFTDTFSQAGDLGGTLTTSLDTAASAAAGTADAAGETASGLAEAAAAAEELATASGDAAAGLVDVEQSQERVGESSEKTKESVKQTSEETRKGVDAASLLSREFEAIQNRATGLLGPVSRFSGALFDAARGMTGIGGLATGGLVAGAAGLLSAADSYKKASDSITIATGATGKNLEGLRDSFDGALRTSGRSAGDLGQILSTLNVEFGATGEELTKLTTRTAGFLKATGAGISDVRNMTQAMKLLGLGAEDTALFQDQLATATEAFGTNISTLISQVKTAGPALSTLGFTPGQIVGLVGELDQAGLAVTRLTPGLTKLAQTATKEGKTAADAFGGLIERIQRATSVQSALSEVQGIFAGRVAASFVVAVRNGAVDLQRLNDVMAEAPGRVSKVGDSVKGLAGQLGLIRNEITASFGRQGLPVLEGIRAGVESVRPTLKELFETLADLGPSFRGFAEGALAPVAALRVLAPAFDLLNTVLSNIPTPLLEAIGLFAAFKVLPFGLITKGLGGIANAFGNLLLAASNLTAGGLTAGVSGLGQALASSLNPALLATVGLAAGIALYTSAAQKNAKEAKAMEDRVDALTNALGKMTVGAEEATPALNELFGKGTDNKFFTPEDLDVTAKLGLSVGDLTGKLQEAARGGSDATTSLRRGILDQVGGIEELIKLYPAQHQQQAALLSLDLQSAEGRQKLTDRYVQYGSKVLDLSDNLAHLEGSEKKALEAVQEDSRARLRAIATTTDASQKRTDAEQQQIAQSIGLTKVSDNYAAALQAVTRDINRVKLETLGLNTADQTLADQRADALTQLAEQGALYDDVAHAGSRQATVINEIAQASKNGAASDTDRILIMERTGATAEQLKSAEEELLQAKEKYKPVSQDMNRALGETFHLMAQGMPITDAITDASAKFGLNWVDVSAALDPLNAKLKTTFPTMQDTSAAMESLTGSVEAGLSPQETMNQLLAASGYSVDIANAALDEYKAGVDATKKALDNLVPSIGSVTDKLVDQSKVGGPRVDAIAADAKARKDALDAEVADLETQKKAEGASTDALDARIDVIRARQGDIDAAVDRAKVAGEVFDTEEAAMRANAAARQTSLDRQIADLAKAKQVAQDTAAAQGLAFDPGPLDAKIAAYQAQRDAIGASLGQDLATVDEVSARTADSLDKTGGAFVDFATSLDLFNAQVATKLNFAQTLTQLKADGMNATVKAILDPAMGFSAAQQQAFITQIATLSPEEKTAVETKSKEAMDALKKAAEGQEGLNLFASANPAHSKAATDRGVELAKSLADGFTTGILDTHLAEIIKEVLAGGDPAEIIAKFREIGGQGASAAKTGATDMMLAEGPVELPNSLMWEVREQMGLDGTTGAQKAKENATAELSIPLDPEVAALLMGSVNLQMAAEGSASGDAFRATLDSNLRTYPIPTEAGTILVSSVSQALSVAGTDAGANYALGVAAGIKLKEGDALSATYFLAQHVDEAGHLALETMSPSKKGIKLGGFYAEGVAIGIEQATPLAVDAVTKMTDAVAAVAVPLPEIKLPPLPQRPLVGAGSLIGAQTGGQFASMAAVQGSQGEQAPTVHIENVNVTGTTNATADEVAEAMSRKIGWLGITGRHEL